MSDERIIPVQGDQSVVSHALLIEGTELPARFEVLSILTHREANRVPWARITFRDGDAASEDFPLSNEPELVPGKEVEVQLGYASQNETVFKGIIVRQALRVIEGGHSYFDVECRDRAAKMTFGRKSRYFLDKTDADIIQEIVQEHGLQVEADATSTTHKAVLQYDATDWDFVLSRADVNGLVLLPEDGKLVFKKPDLAGEAELSLTFGDTIHEIDAEIDARRQFATVTASSWDYKGQQVVKGEGSLSDLNGVGNLKETELASVLDIESLDYRHPGELPEPELKAWAEAQVIKSQLAKAVGRVRFRGYAKLKPGQCIEIAGLGERFSGKALVTGIRQEMNAGSWFTVAQFGLPAEWYSSREDVVAPPASGLLPGISGLQVGVVTALQDPDGEDRIQVRLPMVDPEAEGSWVRVAAPDAGKERGFFFRPEIEDEVVVGFLNGDPRHGVMLGMLHSSNKPAPIQAEDANNEKVLVTRSKIRLHFDDDKKVLTVETPGGNSIVLSDEDQGIIMTDQHGNTITMDSEGVTIKGSKITLEAQQEVTIKAGTELKAEGGTNVGIKAGAQLKAEGSAGAEVSTSAIATLKGSLVKIN